MLYSQPVCKSVAALSALTWELAVKPEKKTVQFSEDVKVETIEPEQEPVFIDEVLSFSFFKTHICVTINIFF